MGFLFGGKGQQPSHQEQQARIEQLEQALAAAQAAQGDTQELARHLDADRELLLGAVDLLKPSLSPRELAEALLGLTFRPLELCSFYVATVDWDQGQILWILYHEGGRIRMARSRDFHAEGGLTAETILARRPLYIRTLEEAMEHGAVLSEAEKASGLVPQSWYGVPLAVGERPFGLVAFQSFQPDTFSESRRRVFDALGALLARSLVLSDPALEQRP